MRALYFFKKSNATRLGVALGALLLPIAALTGCGGGSSDAKSSKLGARGPQPLICAIESSALHGGRATNYSRLTASQLHVRALQLGLVDGPTPRVTANTTPSQAPSATANPSATTSASATPLASASPFPSASPSPSPSATAAPTSTPLPAPTATPVVLPTSPPGVPPLKLVPLRDGYLEGEVYFPNGPTTTGGSGQQVNAMPCGGVGYSYHNHAHVAFFLDGRQLAIPSGIGITKPVYQYKDNWPDTYVTATNGGCYYGLHTHDRSGKLHLEGSVVTRYTLGDFFDMWGQPLSTTQVCGFNRPDIKFYWRNRDVETKPAILWKSDPRTIPLWSRTEVTVVIGTPPAYLPTYNFFNTR